MVYKIKNRKDKEIKVKKTILGEEVSLYRTRDGVYQLYKGTKLVEVFNTKKEAKKFAEEQGLYNLSLKS